MNYYDYDFNQNEYPLDKGSLAERGTQINTYLRKILGAKMYVTLPSLFPVVLLGDEDNELGKEPPAVYEIPLYNMFFITTLHILLLFSG